MNMMSYIAMVVCVILAALATYFGNLQHIVGAPMIGLFIGMVKPIILGGCTWLAVATVSMLYVFLIIG